VLVGMLLLIIFPAVSKGVEFPTTIRAAVWTSNPVADPRAQVVYEQARFTMLTPRLVRMEWTANGKFEDHASLVFINRRLAAPPIQQEVIYGQLTIRTSALELNYKPLSTTDGRFTPQNLSVKFSLNGKSVIWHPGMVDKGNLSGTAQTLDDTRGLQTPIAIEPGLISTDGWTMVDDSTRAIFDTTDFSFAQGERSVWPWVTQRPAGERQDWYFFGYGHDYKQALHDYVQVAGRIPLPPPFAFGIWWSRYWSYSDQELQHLVQEFHENSTPLDVLVIDMDWHPSFGTNPAILDQSGHIKGWGGYSWNPLLFPEPEVFLKQMHDEGLRVTMNLHPASGVQPWESQYVTFAKALGIDPSSHQYVPFDITEKKFVANYFDLLHHPLERQGVDFWWIDWQQEDRTNTPGVNPIWWLAYVHFTDQERQGKRPLILNRWGGLGSHRYPLGFSGDTFSSWDSLAFQPWFTATAANVGFAYWSHDIGGHQPGPVDGELYTRWVQFGVFSPILRTHTTKNPDTERRIWAYSLPYSEVMRDAFQLRCALEPYIYTEARHTYDTGVAFVRPLYYDWPEAGEAYEAKNEYNFGDSLIVAPVTSPMETKQELALVKVWLPPGEWMEWPTGRRLLGPTTFEGQFSLQEVPVYAKAGAIIPMQTAVSYYRNKLPEPLVISIFPLADGQKSSYRVYEDSGKSEDYKFGTCAWTKIDVIHRGEDVEITINPVEGKYPGIVAQRAYELRLPADMPPDIVTEDARLLPFVAGRELPGWRYEGNTLTTSIRILDRSTNEATHIRVHRASSHAIYTTYLDGFAGKMTRLRSAYDTLNRLWPIAWSPDSLIEAMQTGERLTYQPQKAKSELLHFRQAYSDAITSVRELAARSSQIQDELAKRGSGDQPAAPVMIAAQRYELYVQRALAQLTSAANDVSDR
jgi:alpha-glucosidase (family GH31 glycosyl hydrolase)